MRTKFKKLIKVASANANSIQFIGEKKVSTHSRKQYLLKELGIDAEEYNFKASIRMYTRMSTHPILGINYTK